MTSISNGPQAKRGRRSSSITPPPGSSPALPPASPTTTTSSTGSATTTTTTTTAPPLNFAMSIDDRISRMKRNLPLMYDSFIHYGMQWGSLSICWGPLANDSPILNLNDAFPSQYNDEQTIYFAGRTDGNLIHSTTMDVDAPPVWEGQPSELFVSRVAIPKPRTMRRSQLKTFQDNMKSSRVGLEKRIVHPGEVNRLRALPSSPHVVATKSDSPTIFVWNVKTQEHRVLPPILSEQSSFPSTSTAFSQYVSGSAANANASSSLPASSTSFTSGVANPTSSAGGGNSNSGSGGGGSSSSSSSSTAVSSSAPGKKPNKTLQNAQATAARAIKTRCSVPDVRLVGQTGSSDFALDCSGMGSGVVSGTTDGFITYWNLEDLAQSATLSRHGSSLSPRSSAKMHSSAMEDCAFNANGDAVCSVGRDRSLAIWDVRSKLATSRTANAHSDDVNCCHWSGIDPNRIVTGGSDCYVKVWDARRLTGGPLFSSQRRASVINVRFSPFDSDLFALADEASWFEIMDCSNNANSNSNSNSNKREGAVVFQHFGHRGPVVDFSWNHLNAFVLATVSDDSQDETRGGGGTMQVWRVNELALGERLLAKAHAPPSPYAEIYGKPDQWRADLEEKLSVVAGSMALTGSSSHSTHPQANAQSSSASASAHASGDDES